MHPALNSTITAKKARSTFFLQGKVAPSYGATRSRPSTKEACGSNHRQPDRVTGPTNPRDVSYLSLPKGLDSNLPPYRESHQTTSRRTRPCHLSCRSSRALHFRFFDYPGRTPPCLLLYHSDQRGCLASVINRCRRSHYFLLNRLPDQRGRLCDVPFSPPQTS
jgi:hypothetical protein